MSRHTNYNTTPTATQQGSVSDFMSSNHFSKACVKGAAGFGLGLFASLLMFKRKPMMATLLAGTGASAGVADEWVNYQKRRNWMQGQQLHDEQGHERDNTYRRSESQSKQNKGDDQLKRGKEEPLNPEAKAKQDIAEQGRTLNQTPGREEWKMGQGRTFNPTTQDRKKREEEGVYSQSMQGDKHNRDDITSGQRGPQNSTIAPSQRDWTGGHANKGVLAGQVHRGAPENDKMGKSTKPDTAPNTNPDRNVPKQENQALSNVDFKGQSLQTFQSNPLPLGKAGQTHEIQKGYQEGRNRANDPDLDNLRRRQHGLEQDYMGQSVKEGILFQAKESSDTKAGVGNYRPGVAEQNTKNQVNAEL